MESGSACLTPSHLRLTGLSHPSPGHPSAVFARMTNAMSNTGQFLCPEWNYRASEMHVVFICNRCKVRTCKGISLTLIPQIQVDRNLQ